MTTELFALLPSEATLFLTISATSFCVSTSTVLNVPIHILMLLYNALLPAWISVYRKKNDCKRQLFSFSFLKIY